MHTLSTWLSISREDPEGAALAWGPGARGWRLASGGVGVPAPALPEPSGSDVSRETSRPGHQAAAAAASSAQASTRKAGRFTAGLLPRTSSVGGGSESVPGANEYSRRRP